MDATNSRRLYNIAAGVLLAFIAGEWLQNLWGARHTPLAFDDAYMFARYALNIRHGLGISWNLDGVHTYGPTSLLWVLLITVFSFLPVGPWAMLTLASWICSIGAVVAMAWAVARNSISPLFAGWWRVLPLVALPLGASAVFTHNQTTGMETMLAMLLVAVYLGMALRWVRGEASPLAVGGVGLLLFLARPEAALAVVLLPVLLYFLLPRCAVPLRSLLLLFAVVLLGVGLDFAACSLYFHTPVPLSFYMKSRHAYEGYSEQWHPELQLAGFLIACQLYVVVLIFLARRRDARLLVCCLAPALATFVYLQTVTQIMGFDSRYYAPYLPFFVVPALLVLDRRLVEPAPEDWNGSTLQVRAVVAGVVMLACLGLSSESVQSKIRRMEARTHVEYDPVTLRTAATTSLPRTDWHTMMANISDRLIATLPAGATVAATEVGYLGIRAAHLNVIDLAGLNDNDIALHGFNTGALLARRPDLIWLPHSSYTYQRGVLLSDPRLLREYDVYADAGNYGIAVRKDSPFRPQMERQMEIFWNGVYPGYRMSDYLVTSATWSGRKFNVIEP